MKSTKLIRAFVLSNMKVTVAATIGLALAVTAVWLHRAGQVQAAAPGQAFLVQVEASQGFAAPGNSHPANLLVVVTDANGAPVTDLDQTNFSISNQFGLPGQTCGFSNNIVSFDNVLNGAYRIQVDLAVPGCLWVEGDYLTQVAVLNGVGRGQAPTTLSVKCPTRCTRLEPGR